MRYHLSLIRNQDILTAVVLRARFVKPELAGFFQREMADTVQSTLAALRRDCEAGGYGGAWNSPAMVCLGAENAVFHDFMLPTANMGMAKKSLPLLLESEFPFDPAEFAVNTHFFRYGDKKQLGAIATLMPAAISNEWQTALENCGLPGARIFVSPWPLVSSLQTHGKNSLLLCLSGSSGTVCALNDHGIPMRIQNFRLTDMSTPEAMAVAAFRKCGLLLAGLPFKAASLILAGTTLPAGIEQTFGKVFEMPVKQAKDLVRLPFNPDHTGKSDYAWMLATAMFHKTLPGKMRVPYFALRMKKVSGHGNNRRMWLAASCVLILCSAIGVASLLDSMKYRSQANTLRASMLEKLKVALPDAPKNAGAGKLRAILKSRLTQQENVANGKTRHVVLELLENIHAAVPDALNIDVHRLSVDNRHVRIYGHAGSYDDVNTMKEKLEGLKGITGIRIVNAATRASRDRNNRAIVEFELDLARASSS